MRNSGPKAQSIELVLVGTQADFDIGQTLAVSDLRERHGQKLIPAGEITNFVVAVVPQDTAAKLLGMDPVHDLSKK